MSIILKQSTQIDVRIGPFVDVSDGFTPETGITLGTADEAELLKADGAATVDISARTWAAVTGADGWYDLTLTTTDTNTVGELIVVVQDDSVCLPVHQRFQVVEEATYDALFASSATGFDSNGRVDVGTWLGTAVTVSSTTAKPEVDVSSVSDDATAANNLELDYDGTGYNKANSTIGTTTTNTDMISAATVNAQVDQALADIHLDHWIIEQGTAQAGTTSTITLAAGASATDDFYIGRRIVLVAGTGVGEEALITDYNGTTKVATVNVSYSGTWVTTPDATSEYLIQPAGVDVLTWASTTVAVGATGNSPSRPLVNANVTSFDGTGASTTTGANVNQFFANGGGATTATVDNVAAILADTGTDGVLLAGTATSAQLVDDVWDEVLTGGTHNVANSAGRRLRTLQDFGQYTGGFVYVDTNNGTSGTTDFENGTVNNPVDTLADALTIRASIGLPGIYFLPGSGGAGATAGSSLDNIIIDGANYALILNGQSCSGTTIRNATINGNDDGSNTVATLYDRCTFGTNTLGLFRAFECGLGGTITLAEAGTYDLVSCDSEVAGTSTPIIDVGAAVGNTNLNMRRYSGGIEVQQMGVTGTDNMSLEGDGQLKVNANCSGGTIAVRGNFRITDSAAGAVSIVPTTPAIDQVDQGEAQAGSANTITLAATASATDGYYDPGEVIIFAGTGAGQARDIIDYNGTTKVATVGKDWRTNPDSTSQYVVRTVTGKLHVNEGMAQAGGASTITLNSVASATDDIYIGQTVFLVGGTGQDQARIITDYNGTTKVATVHRAWNTQPDSTTSYYMLPLPAAGDSIVNIETDTGTTLPAQISALNNIAAADVLAAGDIDGYTLEETMKLCLAALTGVLAGAATTSITIQAADGSKTRLTATVDADGNRSAVVKDATG